jgi:saccharopine dehydrogenase-like NADP-dependent oxidoreductase
MTNLLAQAINCDDADRAASIIQGTLGIESDDVVNYCFPETWPNDRERRASSANGCRPRLVIWPRDRPPPLPAALVELAANASTAFIPQCGLAPGFVSIVAFDLAKGFEVLDSLRLRVGALPQYPSNALNYNLTWSTDGVINEYCEACEAIVNGVRREMPPLEEREEFSLDGVTYEAFNTSGGVGTLCDTLEGKVRTLNYRTIRYPGHAAIMRALLNDLRLRDRRDVLKDILEHAVPTTLQDVVIIFVTVSGHKKGHLVQETYANKIYSRDVDGRILSAIQITTAAAISTVLDLLATGQLPQSGFIRQEETSIPHQRFGGSGR